MQGSQQSSDMQNRKPRVIFLYNRERETAYRAILRGEGHSAGFWGMIHLPRFGVDAMYVEFEQYVSSKVAMFLRRHIFSNVYFVHAIFLPLLIRADAVFTSAAFGTQLLHTLWPFRKSKWIMHDFSITGLIGPGKTWKQRLFKWLTARADGIVTVGVQETERLKAMFPHLKDCIEYITFGVDLDFFKPKGQPEDGTILAVGFDPDRDWKSLVEAVRGTDLTVVFATRKDRLRGIDLPPNVTYRTFTQPELIDAYDRASVIAIPMDTRTGLNDAMGCSTLFEAMAMRKAIVATDTHTFRSYIMDGENGILVPERDAAALRAALIRVMGDSVLRAHLGANAHRYAETHLDVIMLTKRLADFMKRVIAA
jgi:glycosyltransferase involved in cell wall biosynthesis